MIDLIKQHHDTLAQICQRYHVAKLEIFGSASEAELDARVGDLDFLVEFGNIANGERFDSYFGLLHSLEKLFDRSVDLVESQAMRNPYFIRRVNQSRKEIYAA